MTTAMVADMAADVKTSAAWRSAVIHEPCQGPRIGSWAPGGAAGTGQGSG
jgi:hypothetical protein